jgi:uncharacterized membrane-anchored protein YhcB (DUF1043 family)
MEMTLDLIVLAAIFLAGMLMGYTLTERALAARARWQAAVQRSLDNQWQELDNQWQELEFERQTIAQSRKRRIFEGG